MKINGERPGIPILVNKNKYFASKDRMIGSELKVLGKVPVGNRLYEEVHRNQPDIAISDEMAVDLKPGQHFYDLPPGNVGEQKGHGRPGISIHINNKQVFATKVRMTGEEIKALGNIPTANRLYREESGVQPDTAITDSQEVELRPGDHFYDLPPGVVGQFLPIIQAQIDRAREEWPGLTATQQPDGNIAIEIPLIPTGPSWNIPTTPLLILLPPGYPESTRPSGFKVCPSLLQNGSTPAGGGINEYGGRQWLHLCWQPSQPWIDTDTLWKHIKFSLRRFVEV